MGGRRWGPRTSAKTLRLDSPPSGSMSNAVSRPANDSEMISLRSSGVMTMPLGKWMSPATSRSAAVIARGCHLGAAVEADGHDLPVDSVAEPQPSLMPAWRLRNPKATQQNLRLGHDPSFVRGAASEAGPLPTTRTATGQIDMRARERREI